jgi:type I site-specific restriction endonuclease
MLRTIQHYLIFAALGFCVACAPKSMGASTSGGISPAASSETYQLYSQDRKMLVQADSLFRDEQFELARILYLKIRDAFPQSSSGAAAQFNLAYINIFYNNPFADYSAGLREFKRFQTDYPNDKRTNMVNSWIRLLTVLKDFDDGHSQGVEQLKALKEKQKALMKNFDNLQEGYIKYESATDSLKHQIKKLEGVIEYLDSTRG